MCMLNSGDSTPHCFGVSMSNRANRAIVMTMSGYPASFFSVLESTEKREPLGYDNCLDCSIFMTKVSSTMT